MTATPTGIFRATIEQANVVLEALAPGEALITVRLRTSPITSETRSYRISAYTPGRLHWTLDRLHANSPVLLLAAVKYDVQAFAHARVGDDPSDPVDVTVPRGFGSSGFIGKVESARSGSARLTAGTESFEVEFTDEPFTVEFEAQNSVEGSFEMIPRGRLRDRVVVLPSAEGSVAVLTPTTCEAHFRTDSAPWLPAQTGWVGSFELTGLAKTPQPCRIESKVQVAGRTYEARAEIMIADSP